MAPSDPSNITPSYSLLLYYTKVGLYDQQNMMEVMVCRFQDQIIKDCGHHLAFSFLDHLLQGKQLPWCEYDQTAYGKARVVRK